MKNLILAIIVIAAASAAALADIPNPNGSPRPKRTPIHVVIEPPAPSPTPEKKAALEEYNGSIRVIFDKNETVPVLEIRRSVVQKLMASNGESGPVVLADTGSAGGFTMGQTLVSGVLFSLAFIVGGVWIFRARGGSRTAAGIILGALVGGATVAMANTPPDYVIRLTSRVFSENTKAYGWAENDVKIRLVGEERPSARFGRDDVVLKVPNVEKEKKSDEE